MDRKKQKRERRRRSRDSDSKKHRKICSRRQLWRRPWKTRDKMDQTRMQTQKHKHRCLLWTTGKRKSRNNKRNIWKTGKPNDTKISREWNDTRRRLQCKIKNRNTKRKTGAIKKWKNTSRINKRKRSGSDHNKSWWRDMDKIRMEQQG